MSNRSRFVIKATLVGSLCVPAFLCSAAARAQMLAATTSAQPSGILVGGTGKVYEKPNIARLTLGVTTQDPDPTQAAEANATAADAVVKAVRALGVEEKDVRTEGYSISPQYRYDEGKSPVITGYQVSNTVGVTVRNIANAGKVLDAGVKAGANNAGGIAFDLDDETAARDRDTALAQAVADAYRKAIVIAKAANAGRIDLVSVEEGVAETAPRPMVFARAMSMGKAAPETPVAPGEQTISVSVTVRYSFNPAAKANY